MGTPYSAIQSNQVRKVRIPLHVLLSRHHVTNTAHPSSNNCTGFQFLNGSNTKLLACVTIQSLVLVLPPPISLNYYNLTVLTARSALHQIRVLKLQRFKRTYHGFRSFSHFGPHIWNIHPSARLKAFYHSFFLQKQPQNISLLWIFPLNNTVQTPQWSSADAEMYIPFSENPELSKVLCFKQVAGQNI